MLYACEAASGVPSVGELAPKWCGMCSQRVAWREGERGGEVIAEGRNVAGDLSNRFGAVRCVRTQKVEITKKAFLPLVLPSQSMCFRLGGEGGFC